MRSTMITSVMLAAMMVVGGQAFAADTAPAAAPAKKEVKHVKHVKHHAKKAEKKAEAK